MKTYNFFIVLFFLTGCCGYGDDGGYSYYKSYYYRKIALTDTSNKILKISYIGSEKIFTPNDTLAGLIISDNMPTKLIVETKNSIDTLVVNVENNYSYSSSRCYGDQIINDIQLRPSILYHTFSKIEIKQTNSYKYGTYGDVNIYDIFFITP